MLDFSCSTVSWHKIYYGGSKDGKDKENLTGVITSVNMQNLQLPEGNKIAQSPYATLRPVGAAVTGLEEGFLRTSFIKAIESVDPYDVDIEVSFENMKPLKTIFRPFTAATVWKKCPCRLIAGQSTLDVCYLTTKSCIFWRHNKSLSVG